jgi:hypothetical protein
MRIAVTSDSPSATEDYFRIKKEYRRKKVVLKSNQEDN